MGKQQPMMKIDLHCHSEASWDCRTPLEMIPERCREVGIRVQAITDHNEIWGAQRLKAMVEAESQRPPVGNYPVGNYNEALTIIVGEEITTSAGEIIGLFLKEKIERGLTPEETVEQIKAQGGLVLLPHGFDILKRERLRPEARKQIADAIDIVETFNTRVSIPYWNLAAVAWAEKEGLLMSGGSDAHTLATIGSAWAEVPARPIRGPEDLLAALDQASPAGQWTQPVFAFVRKMWGWLREAIG